MSEGLDRRTVAKSVAGFAVAAVVLYLFGRTLGWSKVFRAMRDANLWLVGVACASSLVALAVWAKAWDEVLQGMDVSIPTSTLVVTYFAATFADYVTPFGKAGGGPFVAYVLSTDERASYEESLASVVTADALNLVPFFTFAGLGVVGLAITGDLPGNVRPLVYSLGAMAVGLPIAGFVVWRNGDRVAGLVGRVGNAVGRHVDRFSDTRFEERAREFFATLDELREDPMLFAEALAFGFVGWLFFALPLGLSAWALDLTIAPLLVAFIVPASTMASFVPTPGGLGGVEAAIVGLVVALTGVQPAAAAALAILYRVASYWFVLLASGAASLYLIANR